MKNRFFAGVSAATIAAFGCGFASAEDSNVTIPTPSILQDLAETLEHDPSDVSTRLRLASMLQNLGQHAEAQAMLDEAMRLSEDVKDALAPGAQIAAGDCVGCELGNSGADVIVGDINGVAHWGATTFNGIAYRAYSVGTTSCNVGTQNLNWFQSSNNHPVIAQNMYKYDGRTFEQIGVGHLKHGFCALQEGLCQSPGNPCQPTGGGCMQTLGIFCSDPYTAGLNGNQSILGPRWQVNAYTGQYPYPFQGGAIQNGTLGRRIAVRQADLTGDTSVRYFAEGQYVTRDDASAGNGNNNASYRETRYFASNGNFAFIGSTQRTQPAIQAWANIDPDVLLDIVEPANDGRFYVASRAYDNGDGTWDYEYAVFNLNNDASGASFSVPTGTAQVSGMGFKGVEYHSGDGVGGVTQDLTDWTATDRGAEMVWEVVDVGANSNALRWSTMYNYSFTANAGPEEVDATIGFFKTSGSITARVLAPAGCAITADTNGDNIVNFADLNTVIGTFGDSGPGLPGDVNGDELVNFTDLNAVLGEFGLDCN
ncbi:MAG: hypothetical protein ACTS27_10190 [Phycisphaerales bacterium]